MGELINLRRARKRKARDAKETAASANRLLHGVSKPERDAVKAENTLIIRRVDARRLEPDKET